ncbi:MAG TPA: PQQ-binding-like beta-propeller repeat protein [Opitutaceae bacterium]|nr:PQQ-binding-like beta-propeller repeat protein [Opitutaceae bacterium]
MSSEILYLGTNAHVVAVDKATGSTLWRTKLKGGFIGNTGFVTLLVQDDRVFAHAGGELFCLDQKTGAVLWNNGLEGLGYELASLASVGAMSAPPPLAAALQQRSATDTALTSGLINSPGH